MNKKLQLVLLLFFVGFAGILTTLPIYSYTIDYTPNLFRDFRTLLQNNWFYLIGPTISLIIAVTVGTLLHDKVNLRLPLFDNLVGRKEKSEKSEIKGIVLYGITGGIIGGLLITGIIIAFSPILPSDLLDAIQSNRVGLITRVFSGAITGEILHRFGFMTFLVWLGYKMSGKLSPSTYWTAIIVSVILFGAAQLTPTLIIGGTPPASLLFYHLLVSGTSVTIAGWLYWKKGLEAAIITHVVANVIMVLAAGVGVFG